MRTQDTGQEIAQYDVRVSQTVDQSRGLEDLIILLLERGLVVRMIIGILVNVGFESLEICCPGLTFIDFDKSILNS